MYFQIHKLKYTNRPESKLCYSSMQIVDYYSTTDKYIRSKTHSNVHQSVFTKENDKYQWIVRIWKMKVGGNKLHSY